MFHCSSIRVPTVFPIFQHIRVKCSVVPVHDMLCYCPLFQNIFTSCVPLPQCMFMTCFPLFQYTFTLCATLFRYTDMFQCSCTHSHYMFHCFSTHEMSFVALFQYTVTPCVPLFQYTDVFHCLSTQTRSTVSVPKRVPLFQYTFRSRAPLFVSYLCFAFHDACSSDFFHFSRDVSDSTTVHLLQLR